MLMEGLMTVTLASLQGLARPLLNLDGREGLTSFAADDIVSDEEACWSSHDGYHLIH